MPYIDAVLFKKRVERRVLRLVLDEGEDILGALRAGMVQNRLKECKVEDGEGKVKQATISVVEGDKFKKMELEDTEIMRATGNFKFNFDELWGVMDISTGGRKPITGTLVRGKAAQGFELKLSFLQDVIVEDGRR